MSAIDASAAVLGRSHEILKGVLADFSDADFNTRPCPGANRPAWQIGHLISVETGMVAMFAPTAVAKLPDGFEQKFSKENSSKDDPAFFGTKAQLLDQFDKTRAATIAWVKTLKLADLEKPTPEKMQRFAANLGELLGMFPVHEAMHTGQFQVTRRKLGKPVKF
jgi:hypothetical protein